MSSNLSTTTATATSTARPVEPSDRRLVVAGVTLGLIGLIAVSIILYWTFHLKVPGSVPTLSDPEAYPSSKDKSSPPSSSAAKGKGAGGLVRKATKTLHSFNNHTLNALDALGGNARYKKTDYNSSAKITPFGASNDEETPDGHKPKFIHIPGQNMRIATRMPNGAWTFSEPDARTNRRSAAWSTFGLGGDASGSGNGGNVTRQRQSTFGFGHGGGNGNGSICGTGGYRGIDASSVSQVSPTTSSFFSHKPRFLGGPGYGYARANGAADSSLSGNTQGFRMPSSPSPSSAHSHSHSPFIKHELRNYDLGLGPVTLSPEAEHENPFDSPLPITPITSDSHTTTSTTYALRRKKEEEASYGFTERDIDPPPPAYTERNRIGSKEFV
ncbi:hypothetical protein L218DRAFT_770062 [Marasmius fiardii PR-910]|nr:hypothetical protein L218DRAFT_770062 [Marasmius fiardii PR-910]